MPALKQIRSIMILSDLSNNEISYKINIDNNKYLFVKINLDGEVKQYQLIEVADADYEKKGFDY